MAVVNDISSRILNWERKIFRITIAAACVSFWNTGYYAYIMVRHRPQGNELILILIGEMLFISYFLGRSKTIIQVIKSVIVLTLITFLVGGGWYGIYNLTAAQETKWLIVYALALDALFQGSYGMFKQERIYQNNICKVKILIQNKTIAAKGYYDSGNCLTEPYGGSPVVIISEALLAEYDISCEHTIMIPYYSLGNKGGMIGAIVADCLCIENSITYYKVYLAIDNDVFVKQKSYDLILHSSMI